MFLDGRISNMQCITVKTHGYAGTYRISATISSGKRMYVQWDYALDVDGNHNAAALAMGRKMEWTGRLVPGRQNANTTVYCMINAYRRKDLRLARP